MRKILLLLFIFCSAMAMGQGSSMPKNTIPVIRVLDLSRWFNNAGYPTPFVAIPGYTNISARYKWIAGAFDSALHVGLWNGVPTGVRTGVWQADGEIAMDTTTGYFYGRQGGVWIKYAKYSDIGSGNFVDSVYRTPGKDSIQFKIAGRYHAIKDSSGGGSGSQNLQQVTDIGDSTTHDITVYNSLLPQNTDLVQASGYGTIPTGSADLGGLSTLYMIHTAQQSRIRQTGVIEQIKMYFNSKPAQLTAFYFDVWRKNGSNYDTICHINILSLISGGSTNTITLPRTASVLEGDYTGFSFTTSSSPSNFLKIISLSNAGYYKLSTPSFTNMNWGAESVLAGYVPIFVYMKAPHIVGIGNSIMAGYNRNRTFIETTQSNGWIYTLPYRVATLWSAKSQDMGIGGQTTTQILARFHDDVVLLKPRYAIIEGGVNDIAAAVSSTTIKANWKAMIDTCIANSIVPIVNLILPWSNGTNAQNRQADTINAYLDSLCTAAPTSIVIDARETLGMFRSGGDAGNFWDIKTAYNADGVHLTDAGDSAWATLYIPPATTVYGNNYITNNGNRFLYPDTSGTFMLTTSPIVANVSTITGTDKRVLFDDNGIVGESSGLNYSKTTPSLGIGRVSTVTGLDVYNSTLSDLINIESGNASGDASVVCKNNFGGSIIVRSHGGTYASGYDSTATVQTTGNLTSMEFITNGDVANGGTSTIGFRIGGYNETKTMTIDRSKVLMTGRMEHYKGSDVSSNGNLTLSSGNLFHITGTTTINAIITTNWQAGSEVTLIFDASVTVKNNTAGGAGTAVMLLAGGADFSATSNDVLKLVYDGTSWFEISRSVN